MRRARKYVLRDENYHEGVDVALIISTIKL